jgi:murein L,D-transpeptidase YcbB/YkuD
MRILNSFFLLLDKSLFQRVCGFFLVCLLLISCNNGSDSQKAKQAQSPFIIQTRDEIKKTEIIDGKYHLNNELNRFYKNEEYMPQWSDSNTFFSEAIALARFIDTAMYCGISPDEYHRDSILSFISLAKLDTNHILPPSFWSKADVILTDASFRIMLHLYEGRLQADSNSLLQNTAKADSFFSKGLSNIFEDDNINLTFLQLQPDLLGYRNLRNGLSDFLSNMDTSSYTHLMYPYDTSNVDDSIRFITNLCTRLKESKISINETEDLPDSATLAGLVKLYQQKHDLQKDGKINTKLVRHLNTTDRYRLKQILVSMDRYKLIRDKIPDAYIWVNLPVFELQAWDADTIAFRSNVICGKPKTPTPTLISQIKEIITYPTWTIPASIIKTEVLPGIKRNAAYLSRKGYGLYDKEGNKINPSSVDWTKYKKGIPYSVRQGSGDNNALGVIKFNFPNPHHVYLHDTNQRYLFKNSNKAMSHGCVRVEQWEQLAHWIARRDSISAKSTDTLKYTADSISNWIAVKKKKWIPVKKPIPLFIQYITCEANSGKIKVHEDIYDLDRKIIEAKGDESVFNLIRS